MQCIQARTVLSSAWCTRHAAPAKHIDLLPARPPCKTQRCPDMSARRRQVGEDDDAEDGGQHDHEVRFVPDTRV